MILLNFKKIITKNVFYAVSVDIWMMTLYFYINTNDHYILTGTYNTIRDSAQPELLNKQRKQLESSIIGEDD